jgi:hypothetical protein
MKGGGAMDEFDDWQSLANPGAVFRYLQKNHACYQIDMHSMPPLDLIEELAFIANLMKKNPNSRAFRAISDLTALVVAAAAGKTYEMFSEIIIRDSLDKFDITYEKFLTSE